MEFTTKIIILVCYAVFMKIYELKIYSKLAAEYKKIFEKYGDPHFFIYGPKEYKFIFNFIVFSGYKNHQLDKKLIMNIKIYKTLFFLLIPVMLIIFNLN